MSLCQLQADFTKPSQEVAMTNNIKKYQTWLQEQYLTPNTIETYGKIIKRYYRNLSLTNQSISILVQQLVKRLEPSTCQTYLATLKSYAKFKKITRIDWAKINKLIPKVQKKFYTTLNQHELELLKQARFEESERVYQRNNLILDFLFYSGVRVGELVNVRHRDWENNSLRIHGKGNKVRYVFLPEWLVKHISPCSPGYLLASSKGKKLSTRSIVKIVQRRVKLAGINKWVSPHTFRRSFATLLNSKGARLTTIQKLLGHSNLETTASYIHNSWEELYGDYSRLWKSPNQISHD
jgi:integrase/recombinase XerD